VLPGPAARGARRPAAHADARGRSVEPRGRYVGPIDDKDEFMVRMDELHRAKMKERAERKIAELDELKQQMLPPDTGHRIDAVDPTFLDQLDAGRPQNARPAQPLSESQVLRREQDQDFARAVDESRREEEERERAQREAQARWLDFVAQFQALPPEPASGTTIQAMMPAGQRVTRTFHPDTPGNLVYVWCAGQTIDAENLLPEQINIVAPVGNVKVDAQVGLSEQGLSGKFAVIVSVRE
jgi:hypothetical protein